MAEDDHATIVVKKYRCHQKCYGGMGCAVVQQACNLIAHFTDRYCMDGSTLVINTRLGFEGVEALWPMYSNNLLAFVLLCRLN